jgi:hypothetical protein
MTKPQSYPFLAIAKRYNLDYGDVLLVADMWRHPAQRNNNERGADKRLFMALIDAPDGVIAMVEVDISQANADFKAIQKGEIDWNTGEPVKELYRDYLKLEQIRFAGTLRDNLAQSRDQFPSFECKHEWMPHGDDHESHCVNCGLIKP